MLSFYQVSFKDIFQCLWKIRPFQVKEVRSFFKSLSTILGIGILKLAWQYFTASRAHFHNLFTPSSVLLKTSQTTKSYSRQAAPTWYPGKRNVLWTGILPMFSKLLHSTLNASLRLQILLQILQSFTFHSVWEFFSIYAAASATLSQNHCHENYCISSKVTFFKITCVCCSNSQNICPLWVLQQFS